MALRVSGQVCELREVVLRDKPTCMLEYSAKGTVPVLVLPDGQVIDESMEMMRWALEQSDPKGWLKAREDLAGDVDALIEWNDGDFKFHLDRYKYTTRYEGADSREHRDQAERFLVELNQRLAGQSYLQGDRLSLVDVAILPFIRQFANTDRKWFDALDYPALQRWLASFLESAEFRATMHKFPQWVAGDDITLFPIKE
jgi:glutathione S-transferase